MAETQKIKVLHLVTRMNVGGVAVLLDNLMSNIDQAKFEAILVTGECESPEGDYLADRQTSYKLIRLRRFHKSLQVADDLLSFISIVKLLRAFKPDIIHTHTSKAGLYGRIAVTLFLPRAKKVHTFHGHLLVGYFNPLKLTIVKGFEKSLALLTTSLVAMGTQVRDDLLKVGIAPMSKFRVFFPGLVEPSFPTRDDARRLLGLKDGVIYCAFVGRLTKIKRPDRVVEVAQAVAAVRPDVEFLVVGEGDLAHEMKTAALKEQLPIQFLGWRQDIPTILAASDLLLLTSDNEAVALTLIEATQAGIPVVTTAAGSVRDVAIDGENGFVTGFESQELAQAVLKLAESTELRNKFGDAGKARSGVLFSIGHMVSDHENLYQELLRK
jgi:glycosyltransferase involved in cell wall biosynthesis